MEQKSYELEILRFLLNKKTHIREIARKTKINHMTVSRKVNDLLKKNVVDYKQEGKNKVYFTKKTAEAQTYIFMAENYALNLILKKYSMLRNIIEKIKKDKRIKIAVLFGSYAKGLAKKDSDIDIYIETKDEKIRKEYLLIDSRLSIKIGKFDKESTLAKEIIKNHVIIKGIEHFYEKNKFFS